MGKRKNDKPEPSKTPGQGKHHKRHELSQDEDTIPKFRPIKPTSDTTPDRLRNRHAKEDEDDS